MALHCAWQAYAEGQRLRDTEPSSYLPPPQISRPAAPHDKGKNMENQGRAPQNETREPSDTAPAAERAKPPKPVEVAKPRSPDSPSITRDNRLPQRSAPLLSPNDATPPQRRLRFPEPPSRFLAEDVEFQEAVRRRFAERRAREENLRRSRADDKGLETDFDQERERYRRGSMGSAACLACLTLPTRDCRDVCP